MKNHLKYLKQVCNYLIGQLCMIYGLFILLNLFNDTKVKEWKEQETYLKQF